MPNNERCQLWSLAAFCFLFYFAATTTSVVIAGLYWLEPEVNATVATKCYTKDCICVEKSCRTSHSYSCGSDGKSTCYWYSYYTCYDCVYTYYTYAGDTYISDTDSTSSTTDGTWCYYHQNGDESDCYYQSDDPADSLTLTKSNNYAGPISYIVIFSIIALALLAGFVIAVFLAFSESNYSYEF